MSSAAGGSRVIVGHGALAVEARLLEEVLDLADEARCDPSLLRLPVRIVVPSRSLRLHLSSRLVSSHGRAVAGVSVRTLFGLAVEIIERSGEGTPRGGALFPILVRRFADAEPLLRSSLAPLVDGWGALVATVRDVVDAGFEEHHADAVDERLMELGDSLVVERARAVVRVASAVQATQRRMAIARADEVLRRAADLVRSSAETAVPARAVFVHGFAEATGVATDLLEALVTRCRTTVMIDEPRDPADRRRADVGVAFAGRLRERLERISGLEVDDAEVAAPAVRMLCAAGTETEVRAIAARIRSLLDGGVAPESVGVVARALGPYALAVERQFGRLGIPYSCEGTLGSWTPAGRRLRALIDLVRLGGAATTDSWLGAAAREGGGRIDLGLGLRACGARRVADVARLSVDDLVDAGDGLPLPVRRGIDSPDTTDGNGDHGRLPRRRLAGALLRRSVKEAATVCDAVDRWPPDGVLAVHQRQLRRLANAGLGWPRSGAIPGSVELDEALGRLAADVPQECALSRSEFVDLLAWELEGVGRAVLGGSGSGVQVLGVVEARGRTFGHLFVLGLNRDVFPRAVREDCILPDRLRAALAVVLPDLSLKLGGFDEERYLFAQLVSASPNVTLSWRSSDDEGKPTPPSPLVQRLQLVGGGAAPDVERIVSRRSVGWPRTSFEHAVDVGLCGDRGRFAGLLAAARSEARPEGAEVLEKFASARLAVLNEQDPDLRSAEGRAHRRRLGPYHGFIGAPRSRSDPRGAPLYVTVAENAAACPWQAFLLKLLRIEESPDPLAGLPVIGPLEVGSVVHAVLEAVCRRVGAELPEELAGTPCREAVSVPWPDGSELQELVTAYAASIAREVGLAWPGMHSVLRQRALPYLAVARDADWRGGRSVDACGVEVEGVVTVADARGAAREVRFKVDRVDRLDGVIRFTDYKSGAAPELGAKEETRRKRVLGEIASGERLQAAAYAMALPVRAQGRYLFLSPRQRRHSQREIVVSAGDGDVSRAFEGTVRAVFGVWDEGAFFPRLVGPERDEEPQRCAWCTVRSACVRGDSGARARLRDWALDHRGSGDGEGLEPVERALLDMWFLGADDRAGAEEAEEEDG